MDNKVFIILDFLQDTIDIIKGFTLNEKEQNELMDAIKTLTFCINERTIKG